MLDWEHANNRGWFIRMLDYTKYTGKFLKVSLKGWKRRFGILLSADETSIVLIKLDGVTEIVIYIDSIQSCDIEEVKDWKFSLQKN